jgi:hypothetical protein
LLIRGNLLQDVGSTQITLDLKEVSGLVCLQRGIRTETKRESCLTEVGHQEVVDCNIVVKGIIDLEEVGGGQAS